MKKKKKILFHTISHPFALESLSVPDLMLRRRKYSTRGIDANQGTEVETGKSNEQVLKQTDESWDRRLGKEMEKISDPLFTEHSQLPHVISRPYFKKQEEKQPTSLVFALFVFLVA